MVFSSITFLYFFLPAVIILYLLSPKNAGNFILLAAGLLFYAWVETTYLWVMIASSLVDYAAGIYIDRSDKKGKKRLALIISMCVDLRFLFGHSYSSNTFSLSTSLYHINGI